MKYKSIRFYLWSRLGILCVALAAAWTLLAAVPFDEQLLDVPCVEPTRSIEGVVLHEPRTGHAIRFCGPRVENQAMLAFTVHGEDHRFYHHVGIDPVGVARALRLLATEGPVSGASTISMQTIKMALGHGPRTPWRKWREIVMAVHMEMHVDKSQILQTYLQSIPYGHRTTGVHAASHRYFRKEVRDLTLSEASALAVLPRAPTYYNPFRYPERHEQRRQHLVGLLDRRARLSTLGKEAASRAPRFDSTSAPYHPQLAPYTQTTIRVAEQKSLALALERMALPPAVSVAAILVDAQTGEVQAVQHDRTRGAWDTTRNKRPAGTILRPFVAAEVLHIGYHELSPVMDLPIRFRDHRGSRWIGNTSETYAGPINVRRATFAGSEASHMVMESLVSQDDLHTMLMAAGVKEPQAPLLDTPISLLEVAQAARVLANSGTTGPLSFEVNGYNTDQKVVESDDVARVNAILGDPLRQDFEDLPPNIMARSHMFTSTSDWGRNHWLVAYSSNQVLVAWAGMADGSPLPDEALAADALWPLVDHVFPTMRAELPEPSTGLETVALCAMSGKLAGHDCPHRSEELLPAADIPSHECDVHSTVRIERSTGLRANQSCEQHTVQHRKAVRMPSRLRPYLLRWGNTPVPTQFSWQCEPTLGFAQVESNLWFEPLHLP